MKPYHIISGIIFGLVALIHILRLANHWSLILGPWSAPMAMSWIGLVVTGALSVWSFRLIR